jgi:hypothetical protein
VTVACPNAVEKKRAIADDQLRAAALSAAARFGIADFAFKADGVPRYEPQLRAAVLIEDVAALLNKLSPHAGRKKGDQQ